MSKQIYQTEIKISHYGKTDVTFTRRNNETRQYNERCYVPGEKSLNRLNETVNHWVKRNWAEINLSGRMIFIEPTI